MTALLLMVVCFADRVDAAYMAKDTLGLHRLTSEATTREDSLFVRYREYALLEDPLLLVDIPTKLDEPNARELAILSRLWAARIDGAGALRSMTYGLRAVDLLQEAKSLGPEDPLVVFMEAVSLLFRPAFTGGNPPGAVERLRWLRGRVATTRACGVPLDEVDVWLWFAMDRIGMAEANALRLELLGRPLAPIHREFLTVSQ